MAKPIKKEKIGMEVKAAPLVAPPVASAPAKVATTTPVRNSAIPKMPPTPQKKAVTHEQIARRAYEISISGNGGSDFDNWIRAEKELKGEI